jgi:hypothetical protein
MAVLVEFAVACGAPRKPRDEHACDREARGCKRVGEVTFRPRARPDKFDVAVAPRGENAARVRKR